MGGSDWRYSTEIDLSISHSVMKEMYIFRMVWSSPKLFTATVISLFLLVHMGINDTFRYNLEDHARDFEGLVFFPLPFPLE